MPKIFIFFKTTFVGGILFLVPVVVIAVIIGKAHQIAMTVTGPLSELIAVQTVAGIGLVKLLTLIVLIMFCFMAGLFARTAMAQKMLNWIETAVLSHLPGYRFMKGMGESVAGVESEKPHEPVLVRIEDAWQIGFLVERIEGGHAAIYVPGSPSPWSGSVYFMQEERFKPLDIPTVSLLSCLRKLGDESNVLLQGKL